MLAEARVVALASAAGGGDDDAARGGERAEKGGAAGGRVDDHEWALDRAQPGRKIRGGKVRPFEVEPRLFAIPRAMPHEHDPQFRGSVRRRSFKNFFQAFP